MIGIRKLDSEPTEVSEPLALENLGDHIRGVRKTQGLTQEAVARRAGITLKAFGELERDEVQDPHEQQAEKLDKEATRKESA